jgi:hypothetical protein
MKWIFNLFKRKCNHKFEFLAVEKEQTSRPIDDDFDIVSYHLICQKCGSNLLLNHAKIVGGVDSFLSKGCRV